MDRAHFTAWYRRNRDRSRALFDLLADDAYYSRPIALRHPIVFYEGHLPAFSFNTLVKKGARRREHRRRPRDAVRARHRSRTTCAGRRAVRRGAWPARDDGAPVRRRGRSRGCSTRSRAPTSIGPVHPLLDRAEAVFTHPRARGDAPGDAALHVASAAVRAEARARPATRRRVDGVAPRAEWIEVPAGPRDARRRSRHDAVRLGQRVPGVQRPTCRRSRSSGTT